MTTTSGSNVQTLAHFLARLEVRHALGGHVDGVPGTRIPALPGIPPTSRESSKTAKLDAPAFLQLFGDRIEKSCNDAFDLLHRKIGVVVAQFLDKFGSNHG